MFWAIPTTKRFLGLIIAEKGVLHKICSTPFSVSGQRLTVSGRRMESGQRVHGRRKTEFHPIGVGRLSTFQGQLFPQIEGLLHFFRMMLLVIGFFIRFREHG